MKRGLGLVSLLSLAVSFAAVLFAGRAFSATVTCTGGAVVSGDASTDLAVTGPCTVAAGTYTFHNVNIYATDPAACALDSTKCGSLTFADDPAGIDFYAESIIVENGGGLIAGSATTPIGTNCSLGKCGRVTIHLWGAAADQGAICKSSTHCGIPDSSPTNIWGTNTYNTNFEKPPTTCKMVKLPGGVNDCFYDYKALDPADETANIPAYFGHKVLAVSYGGTLELFGKKGAIASGATTPCDESDASCSGTSLAGRGPHRGHHHRLSARTFRGADNRWNADGKRQYHDDCIQECRPGNYRGSMAAQWKVDRSLQ
jgi:hypothetical protein